MKKNKQEIIAKLNALSNGKKSQWVKDAERREQHSRKLRRSQLIAIKILSKLRSNKAVQIVPSTQAQLADLMGVTPQQVNKWVKGNGNYTFDTIDKIEEVLNIELIHVAEPKSIQESSTYSAEIQLQIKKPEPTASIRRSRRRSQGKIIPLTQENVWTEDENYAYN